MLAIQHVTLVWPPVRVQHADSLTILESFRGPKHPGKFLYLDPPYPDVGEKRYYCGGSAEMHNRLHF